MLRTLGTIERRDSDDGTSFHYLFYRDLDPVPHLLHASFTPLGPICTLRDSTLTKTPASDLQTRCFPSHPCGSAHHTFKVDSTVLPSELHCQGLPRKWDIHDGEFTPRGLLAFGPEPKALLCVPKIVVHTTQHVVHKRALSVNDLGRESEEEPYAELVGVTAR